MRFSDYTIVLQEVPNEISLCFTIVGCKLKCDGCHSPYLWKTGSGKELNSAVFNNTLNKYDNLLSCVLFMGGEWHESELIYFLKIARDRGLKTCLYTGLNDVSEEIKQNLNYIKVGYWDKKLGGLNNKNTNQKFINLDNGEVLNYLFSKLN